MILRLFGLYDRFAWRIDWATKYFCVGLTTLMFVIIMAQVFFNYVLRSGLSWSEEFSRLLMAWLTFAGASMVTRRSLHIGMNALVDLLPIRVRSGIKLAGFVICLSFVYALTVWGWRLCIFGKDQTSNYLSLSYFWFYFGIPLGGVLIFIQLIYLVLIEIRTLFNVKKTEKEIRESKQFTPEY